MVNLETVKKLKPGWVKVLKAQCRFAKAKFNEIDFSDDKWYSKTTWTGKQEDAFKKWLLNALYTDAKLRNELCEVPIKTKRHLQKVANSWNFMYGFRTEE